MRQSTQYSKAVEAGDWIKRRSADPPHVGIVVGSGLGAVAEPLRNPVVLPYDEIPYFPVPTTAGHTGTLRLGTVGTTRVAIFQGRFHAYEGHHLHSVTFPVRVLQRLGASRLILTAATGGIREDLAPGSIVCLSDHLNLLGRNPLRGPNDDRLGVRFLDLTEVYSKRLQTLAAEEAERLGIALKRGVYACMPGPSYETPAEIRMLRLLGADVVGMSTVPEAIVARHARMKVLAFAVVTNWAAGITGSALSHEEVLETGQRVGDQLADLIEAVVQRMSL